MSEMKYRIETLNSKKLVGMTLNMSLAQNRTGELWRSFAPRISEINRIIGTDKYSVQWYHDNFFQAFNPYATFDKWATVEVTNFEEIPTDMVSLTLQGGLYVVFEYKGLSTLAPTAFRYIFDTWLPASGYQIDQRHHFEVLGDKYKNNDPNSEEEIWIPIQPASISE